MQNRESQSLGRCVLESIRRPTLGYSGLSFAEALVVVAVIMLVGALLLPVFASAREKARQSLCTSNLQQIGMAFQQYAQDNDQTLFNPFYFGFCDKTGPDGFQSNSTLEPYLKNRAAYNPNSVWVCPEITKLSTVRVKSPDGWGAFYCTYTMNVFLNPSVTPAQKRNGRAIPDPDLCYSDVADQALGKVSWNGGGAREDDMALSEPWNRADVPPTQRPIMRGVRIAEIVDPSRTDLVFEGIVEDLYRRRFDSGYIGRAPHEGDYTLDQGFWPAQKQAELYWGLRHGFTLQNATRPRHGAVNNYLFCDGHVKALRPKTYPYDVQRDPDNIWFMLEGRQGKPIPPPGGPGC